MTLDDLQREKPPKITIQIAAPLMNVTPRFLQTALQQEKYPFGVAVKMGNWEYYINTERFLLYMRGCDLGGNIS